MFSVQCVREMRAINDSLNVENARLANELHAAQNAMSAEIHNCPIKSPEPEGKVPPKAASKHTKSYVDAFNGSRVQDNGGVELWRDAFEGHAQPLQSDGKTPKVRIDVIYGYWSGCRYVGPENAPDTQKPSKPEECKH